MKRADSAVKLSGGKPLKQPTDRGHPAGSGSKIEEGGKKKAKEVNTGRVTEKPGKKESRTCTQKAREEEQSSKDAHGKRNARRQGLERKLR